MEHVSRITCRCRKKRRLRHKKIEGSARWLPTFFVFLGFALTSRNHCYLDVGRPNGNSPGNIDAENSRGYNVNVNGRIPNTADAFTVPSVFVRKATIPSGVLSPKDSFQNSYQKRSLFPDSSSRNNIGPMHQTPNDDESSLSESLIGENDERKINGSAGTQKIVPNKNETETCVEGRTLLSPNHLLYPDTFRAFDAPLSSTLPLLEALRIMKESLTTFLSEANNIQSSPCWVSPSSKPNVLRIEQKISHKVEPLCWLDAQIDSGNPFDTIADHPAFYMETAEETFETAVIGSSRTHKGSLYEDAGWWGQLPNRARVYGGSRFDTETEPSDEWKSFSKGFWMLPAVELRREQQLDSTKIEGEEKSESLTFTATLATHLVSDGDGDFAASARHVLSILEGLTDISSPAIPPTKIPPILSRSSTYHRRIQKQSISDTVPSSNSTTSEIKSSTLSSEDAQEVYERGVAAAVIEFSRTRNRQRSSLSNKNGTTADTTMKPVDNNSEQAVLEKVVLARRLDLQFDPSAEDNIRALEILKKWKYASRPGGHLMYICPNINGDYEFFGCTPERLFQVVSTSSGGINLQH